AGYNLRLLTVVQAMSQLDAVYGEKESRTFATNHGLQILFAPREQRDADEYSAMLGQFTERAISRGRSRSFGNHGHNSISSNQSDQRRALLLPQEFKEIGPERVVVIAENCKPILGEKIRYHRDKAFQARLRPPPPVPVMNIDLHLARVQQRWSYAPDEIAVDEKLDIDALAQPFSALPDPPPAAKPAQVGIWVDGFFEMTRMDRETMEGGSIEPATDLDIEALDRPAVEATATA
ncbi:MAG: type IV secretory system conjugative DNA transfer family protein, partial [Caldimonas sp.]